MHDYTRNEIIAGAFLVLGLVVLGYLSISIGGITIRHPQSYRVRARFSNIGDLKARSPVKVAGVTVGKVQSVRLVDYFGEVELLIDRKILLPKDTIASIATAGLLGESYVSLSPGGSDVNLRDDDRISHTEPAMNVADLIAKYAFGGAHQDAGEKSDPGSPAAPPAPSRPRPQPRQPEEQFR